MEKKVLTRVNTFFQKATTFASWASILHGDS